jgi:hypothetical protein
MTSTKICTRCKKEKHRDEFKKDYALLDNRRSQCKECDNKLSKERRDKIKADKKYDLV